MAISVTDPIGRAINRAAYITFKPFDLGKWFVLGFVAWLSGLGEGGGGGFGGHGNTGGGRRGPAAPFPGGTGRAAEKFHEVWGWLSAHMTEVVLIGVLIAAIVIGLSLLILWVSSRGKFMFLEAICNNTYEVAASWRRYVYLGNSLFTFRICLTLLGMTLVIPIIAIALGIAWPDIRAQRFETNAITAILMGLGLLLPVVIVFGIVSWCTNNFVTTIMYAGNLTVLAAWREFRANIVPGHVGTLVLFFLMQLVLSIAIGIASVIVGCVTCCIGFLPYLSTVITLPLRVFGLCYPVYFLQQFGPRYVIIREPLPPGGFPVMDFPQQT